MPAKSFFAQSPQTLAPFKYKGTLYNSLISYWKLGEATGVARADSAGTNTLTNNNSVSQGAGVVGNASVFVTASSQSLTVASNSTLQMGAGVKMSVAGWVNMATVSGVQAILTKWDTSGSREYELNFTTNRFLFAVTPDGATFTSVTANNFGAPSSGTWYFLYASYDGAHINISVNNGTANTAAYSSDIFSGTATFALGRIFTGGPNYLNASLQDWGFWKRVLTAAELTALYGGGTPPSYPF